MSRRYTEAEKRLVLDRLIQNGGDVILTAEESGVDPTTLYRWMKSANLQKTGDLHLQHLQYLQHFQPAPPLHAIERGLGGEENEGEGPGVRAADPLEPFIPAMVAKASDLLDSIDEAIEDAPLNQRVAALVQLIDRIERMRFRRAFRPAQPPIDPMDYEIRVAHHVEKEDDLEDTLDDPPANTPPEPAYRAEE